MKRLARFLGVPDYRTPTGYELGILFTAWYLPALCTIGFAAVLLATVKGRGKLRVAGAVFIGLIAVGSWLSVVPYALPAYEGTTTAGTAFPEFSAELARGGTLTAADLRKGKKSVVLFYRGRW